MTTKRTTSTPRSAVDAGLARIRDDHAYMRAGEMSAGLEDRVLALTDEILRLRTRIWHTEQGAAAPRRTVDAVRAVRRLKRRLMASAVERRERGAPMPPGYEEWWRAWEAHRWPPPFESPWSSCRFPDGRALPEEPSPEPANDATVVSQQGPTQMAPGRRYTASVTMRNCGTGLPWRRGGSYPCALGSQSPPDNIRWGVSRVPLPEGDVWPGDEVTFVFTVTAPSAPGRHHFQWRMVQEGREWFGSPTGNTAVMVAGTDGPEPPLFVVRLDPADLRFGQPKVRHFVRPHERPASGPGGRP